MAYRLTDNSYKPKQVDGQWYIWLQSHGWQKAKPASELQIGDFMVWNFGSTSQVVGVEKETKCFITFKTRSSDIWNDWSKQKFWLRRMKKDRLVAFCDIDYVKVASKNYKDFTEEEIENATFTKS